MAGSWPASSTPTGGTWSSTRPIRRSVRWAGCCWPSQTRRWPRSVTASCGRSGRTRASAAALRAVASRKRPLVVFLDDLQWAGRTPLGFIDLVLSEEPVDGLLLVGAYRDEEVNAAHVLAVPLSRWLDQAGVRRLRLGNLPEPGLATMVAEMLHVDRSAAAGLAGVIEPYTRGNPYETVELLNALRGDGLLTAAAAGWRWDEAAVRAHLGRSEIAGLLAARAGVLPE